MPGVRVLFHSELQRKLGKGKVKVKADNMRDVLERLEEKFGSKFRDLLYDGNKVKSIYIFLVNGNVVDRDDMEGTKLSRGDVIHIFTPIPGG